MAYIGEKIFTMGSLTGKFSKGILGDFIFKAAVWSTGCFKSSVPGKRKQSIDLEAQNNNVTCLRRWHVTLLLLTSIKRTAG